MNLANLGIVKLSGRGYSYEDAGNQFSETQQHNYLFKYVNADVSHFYELMKKYVGKKVDLTSADFETTDYNYKDEDIKDIRKALINLHPYYFNYAPVTVNAIIRYFDEWLIYSGRAAFFWQRIEEGLISKSSHFIDMSEMNIDDDFTNIELQNKDTEKIWYMSKLYSIISGPLLSDYNKCSNIEINDLFEKSFDNYYKKISTYIDDNIEPVGFSHLIETHKIISRMISWILDVNPPIPEICELTVSQRAWLYMHIFKFDPKQHSINAVQYLYTNTSGINDMYNTSLLESVLDHDIYISSDYKDLYIYLDELQSVEPNIPDNLKNALINIINDAKKEINEGSYEQYEIYDLRQLLFLEIFSMIKQSVNIKRCKNCNMYFVLKKKNIGYCDRITAGQNKTCKDIGPDIAFRNQKKNDDVYKIYRREYHRRYAKTRKTLNNNEKAVFEKWAYNAQIKWEEYNNGELDRETFLEWIENKDV